MLKPYSKYKDSQTNWINNYPAEWEFLKIKFLFTESVEKGFPNEPLLAATQTKGVVLKTQYENRTVIAQKDLHLLKLVKTNDFVISLRSFQGGIEKAYYQGIISPAYTILVPTNKIYNEYFRHLAKSKPFIKLLTTCVTGIREGQNIDYELLRRVKLPVPTLSEQHQIASYLDWKTSLINKFTNAKKHLIELLKEQKQIIINDAVTGKIDVRTGKPYPKYKDSGVEWLGMIPEGWNINRLRSFATSNASGVDKISVINEFAVRLCNYIDVYKNNIIDDSLNFMKGTAKEEEISKFKLKEDDVIITKDSETWDDIAVPAYVPKELPDVICAYHLSLIRTSKEKVLGEFLYNSFSSEALLYQFRISANGVTRYGLSQGAIKDGLFPIPSVLEQRSICNYINCMSRIIEKLIEETEKELILIHEYRTSIISDVVTGKVDVRDIQVPEFEEETAAGEPEEDLAEEPALTNEESE